MFSYEGNNFANLMRRHPQLVAESLLQFLENRLANQEIMFGNHDSEQILTDAPCSECGYQDVGVQQNPHVCRGSGQSTTRSSPGPAFIAMAYETSLNTSSSVSQP